MKNPFIELNEFNQSRPIIINALNILYIKDYGSSRAIVPHGVQDVIYVKEPMHVIQKQIQANCI